MLDGVGQACGLRAERSIFYASALRIVKNSDSKRLNARTTSLFRM
jgi:hypothetical protein